MRKNGSLKRSIRLINVKAEKAIKKAVAKTIQEHALTGDPIVIWRNGKVIWVPARQLRQQHRKQ